MKEECGFELEDHTDIAAGLPLRYHGRGHPHVLRLSTGVLNRLDPPLTFWPSWLTRHLI